MKEKEMIHLGNLHKQIKNLIPEWVIHHLKNQRLLKQIYLIKHLIFQVKKFQSLKLNYYHDFLQDPQTIQILRKKQPIN